MPEFVTAKIGTCWWCGSPANSREHKFKRTDIERWFGPGPYRDGRTLVKYGHDQHPSDVTGSKSKVFKFEPMICSRCNGERSQPLDSAYDLFMEHLFANEAEVLASGEIDLHAIYGTEWESKGLDLARYFVKHICCRLANITGQRKILLDSRLVEFLNGGEYPRCLGLAPLIDMSVAECWRAMRLSEADVDFGSFFFFTGIGGAPAPRPEPIDNPEAGMIVGWIGIYWRIADDEYIPNQFAGPVVEPVVTDWLLGTDNRAAFASLSTAIESGEIDPHGKTFDELMSEFATEPWDLPIHPEEEVRRPEHSPLGRSGVPAG